MGNRMQKKVGLNICDFYEGTLKKNHQFLSENWVYMILWGPLTHRFHGKKKKKKKKKLAYRALKRINYRQDCNHN